MSFTKVRLTGVQGAALVAITYVYFLIFAQFAFLHRLDSLGIAGAHLKMVMAAMALGGIALSLLAPRIDVLASPVRRLQFALGIAAIAAFVSIFHLGLAVALLIALLIGAGLGLLTVTLVTHLRLWTGNDAGLWKVGLGTGFGYWVCNVPSLFTATPERQALVAGVLCLGGIALANCIVSPAEGARPSAAPSSSQLPFVLVVASFAALIWLDSAAFFIIQNTAVLKAGTWQGSAHLWANGLIHLSAAICSAWLLSRRGLLVVLGGAVGALAFACLLLLDPARAITASLFYPIGVSLYSVAIVAYPSLLSPAGTVGQRGLEAGWIYAIAGWISSALGIGMGQNLGHVPPAFVAAASVVVLMPLLINIIRHRPRELALTGSMLVVAFVLSKLQPFAPVAASPSAIERGRVVYISEGCIHCHSQYVRPDTTDVLMWGPVGSLEQIHRQQPPLIGNRRQGPDLSQVGVRRSPLWLKIHLMDPQEVSGSSIMPSYEFLFRDQRGNDLVAYLASLRGPGLKEHVAEEQQWRLSNEALRGADPAEGGQLYAHYCATCHNADGTTRLKWQSEFIETPAVFMSNATPMQQRVKANPAVVDHFAQIIKFGIPDSDMAGHEYLSDHNIASLSVWLAQRTAQGTSTSSIANQEPGEKK